MSNNEKAKSWELIPLILVLALMPLVCIIHKYDCGLEKYPWYPADGTVYDFFLYYRSRLLIIIGVMLLALLIWKIVEKKIELTFDTQTTLIMGFAGLYLIFMLFSALLAGHVDEAVWGGYEQWEGALVAVTYILVFVFAFFYIRSEGQIHVLTGAFVIGAFLVGLLGTFQAFGLDYIKSDWMHGILTMLEASVRDIQVALNFEEGMVFSTLYNPNYVGSYVALALPVMAGIIVGSRKLWQRILAGASIVVMLISLYFSESLTGFIGIGAIALVAVIFLIPLGIRHRRVGIPVAGGVVLILLVLLIVRPAFIGNMIDRVTRATASETNSTIKEMSMKNNQILIETRGGQDVTIDVSYGEGFQFQARNGAGETITPQTGESDASVTFPLSSGETLTLTASIVTLEEKQYPMFALATATDSWNFIWYLNEKKNESSLKFLNAFNRPCNLKEIETFGFEGRMTFATNRGYIWSRTLPMLPDHIFLGCGRDNFTYTYPNDDYVGKQNYGFTGQIMTKPHNMFMQIWVEDGLLALIGMLGVFVLFVLDCFRLYWGKMRGGFLPWLSLGILHGSVAFMVVGLANDSTISVTPIYWLMIGVGFAANRIVRAEVKNEKEA